MCLTCLRNNKSMCVWNGVSKGQREWESREEAKGQTGMGLIEHGKDLKFLLHI